MYRLPAIAAILFYWMRITVVQQLTCLTLGRSSGPVCSTGELLNTPHGDDELMVVECRYWQAGVVLGRTVNNESCEQLGFGFLE